MLYPVELRVRRALQILAVCSRRSNTHRIADIQTTLLPSALCIPRSDTRQFKRAAIVGCVVSGAHRAEIRRALARISSGSNGCAQPAGSLEVANPGFAVRRRLRLQHDGMLGREAVPCRMEVRAEIGSTHLRQNAAEISSTPRMARARPSARVRPDGLPILRRRLRRRRESLIKRRTPGGKHDGEARQKTEEDAHHAGIYPRATPEASHCTARQADQNCAAIRRLTMSGELGISEGRILRSEFNNARHPSA